MKICTKCKQSRKITEFYKDKKSKDKLDYVCKYCKHKDNKEWKRTKHGMITEIYHSQLLSSKTRKHNPPTYTKQELEEWIYNKSTFATMYAVWIKSNYNTDLKPSIDRLSDDIGYSFENIQLMTWGENRKKAEIDHMTGKLKRGTSSTKAVQQFDLNGVFIKEYVSQQEASRQNNLSQGNIAMVCVGKRKKTGGFVWKFKT